MSISTKFKTDTLARLRALLRPADWMIAADLQSGYHHLEVCKADQEYLGFQSDGRYYVFRCLPFGLASAPDAFTLLTRQLVKRWRRAGIRMIHYLDDFLWLAQILAIGVREDLEYLGFFINYSKSTFAPTQCLQHLGFLVDTRRMVFAVLGGPPQPPDSGGRRVAGPGRHPWRTGRCPTSQPGSRAYSIPVPGAWPSHSSPDTIHISGYSRSLVTAGLMGLAHPSLFGGRGRRALLEKHDRLLSPGTNTPPPSPAPQHVLYTDTGDHYTLIRAFFPSPLTPPPHRWWRTTPSRHRRRRRAPPIGSWWAF
jgi:hypothetical protein